MAMESFEVIQLYFAFLVKIFTNPAALLTFTVPVLVYRVRDKIKAAMIDLQKEKGRGSTPSWAAYIIKDENEKYTNFLAGFYSLCGGWIALIVALIQFAVARYLVSTGDLRSFGFTVAETDWLLVLILVLVSFLVIGFFFLVMTLWFSPPKVIEAFFKPKRQWWPRFAPPPNRLFFGRLTIFLISSALIVVDIFVAK